MGDTIDRVLGRLEIELDGGSELYTEGGEEDIELK